jgi:hypothetical protein
LHALGRLLLDLRLAPVAPNRDVTDEDVTDEDATDRDATDRDAAAKSPADRNVTA